MTRYVLTTPVTIAATDYQHPARVLPKGSVVELSSTEVTAIGAGNLRTTVARDLEGEGVGVSN